MTLIERPPIVGNLRRGGVGKCTILHHSATWLAQINPSTRLRAGIWVRFCRFDDWMICRTRGFDCQNGSGGFVLAVLNARAKERHLCVTK